MRLRINLNFRLLFQAVVLSCFMVGAVSSAAYLTYVVLSALFASSAVFFSLFGLFVTVGVLLTYDADLFQWDNNPRIAIKQIVEVIDDGDE